MNATKLLLVASIAAASFAAMADVPQEGNPRPEPFQSTVTPAQVQADLAAYKKAGVNPWSISYNQIAAFKGGRSRADVRAEYLASRDQVAAMTREDSGSAYLAQVAARPHVANTNLAAK